MQEAETHSIKDSKYWLRTVALPSVNFLCRGKSSSARASRFREILDKIPKDDREKIDSFVRFRKDGSCTLPRKTEAPLDTILAACNKFDSYVNPTPEARAALVTIAACFLLL